MTKHEQVANIITFLAILFGEDDDAYAKIMDFSPGYIIEKFDKYIAFNGTAYPWGLHPYMRRMFFNRYVDKWELELSDEESVDRRELMNAINGI